MDPNTKRLDRSGEKNLNPFDTHAIEAAMQVKEGGKVDVEEVVAVTMGPESAVRALHKAVSLGADRSVHLTDDALAGSDVCATGYALAQVLKQEQPDLVLLGQQSDDGECYTIGAVVADHLQMPSLTQVIKMDVESGKLRCERQAEYGYDTVEVELPAVIAVGDAINEPRYPSLKAIMGAKKKPLDSKNTGDAEIESGKVGEEGSRTRVLAINPPPEKAPGEIIEDEDTNETVEKSTARLNAGVTMEVTEVKVQDGKLVAVRPILQDSAVTEVEYVGDPGIIIGRLNAFEMAESGDGQASVEDIDVQLSDWSTKATMVERAEPRGADGNIEDADILVAGGRGLGKAEGFQLCEDLADALGGAVAATRAVVDAGWYPYAAQIGQTGKTVAPKLYLAAGISGAIQHKVGMQSSENIVAINKDANAPIFEFSDLGIVGDLNKILPKLTEAAT